MGQDIKIIELNGSKVIVVGNEVFDWGLDPEDVKKLKFACGNDPEMTESYIGNIKNHFMNSFSEFIGRKVTIKEILEGIKSGSI